MKKSLVFAFSLIGQIGFAIAIPLVALGLFGKYLDRRFETGPYLFLLGLAIGTIIAYYAVRKIALDAIKNMNHEE